jgi:hypothetical protein
LVIVTELVTFLPSFETSDSQRLPVILSVWSSVAVLSGNARRISVKGKQLRRPALFRLCMEIDHLSQH